MIGLMCISEKVIRRCQAAFLDVLCFFWDFLVISVRCFFSQHVVMKDINCSSLWFNCWYLVNGSVSVFLSFLVVFEFLGQLKMVRHTCSRFWLFVASTSQLLASLFGQKIRIITFGSILPYVQHRFSKYYLVLQYFGFCFSICLVFLHLFLYNGITKIEKPVHTKNLGGFLQHFLLTDSLAYSSSVHSVSSVRFKFGWDSGPVSGCIRLLFIDHSFFSNFLQAFANCLSFS